MGAGRARGPRDAPVYTNLSAAKVRIMRRAFVVEVSVPGHGAETGEGGSKREAEQDAAGAMLARLQS